MRVEPTELPGVALVTQERHADERGWFARTWCAEEMAAAGLPDRVAQLNFSHNATRGTLRGLHWQADPHAEDKLVWVARGAVWDVAADVRAGSPTFGRWVARELSAANGCGLAIPKGFAHGFLTLTDDALVVYVMSTPYHPDAARGARYDDAALAIDWPAPPFLLSDRDRSWPALQE